MNHCVFCSRKQNKPNENSINTEHINEPTTRDISNTKASMLSIEKCQHHNDIDQKLRESQIRSLLAHIDKTPIKCPISRCAQLIGITSVMRHFLRDHRTRIPVDFHECYEDERIGVRFSETMLKHEETVCLGVLAYGGNESDNTTRPGKSGLSLTNFMLPENYSQLINHMAITILARKLSLASLLSGEYSDDRQTLNDIVIIWLAAAETTRKVHCTVTALNILSSRSVIIEIQNLKFADRKQLLDERTNFLILNRGDINSFSNNQQNFIELEICVHEINSDQYCGG